ncbi:MAG: DUF5615 family PIN-like protein [Nitrospirae bacterium]|nr:DUF5615 family PIN-like protein [Nitrospirota bacterium]
MKIIVDNNLPASLAHLIRSAGFDASHVVEIGMGSASDAEIRRKYDQENIIFVSRDSDFWFQRPKGWSVAWISVHNPTLAQLRGPIAQRLKEALPRMTPGSRMMVTEQAVVFYSG